MRPLPIAAAFAHALNSTTSNIRFAWFVSWPWMAVLLPVLIAGNLYVLAKTGGDPKRMDGASAATSGIMMLLNALAFSSIAVNWHRYVLLDEVPRGSQRLRLDDTAWRYFGNMLLIFLLIGIIGFAVSTAIAFLGVLTGTAKQVMETAALVAVTVLGLGAFYRLGIKLPAVALGRRDFGLGDAWRMAAGNGWPILGLALLYLVTVLAAGIALWVVGVAVGRFGGLAAVALIVAVQMVASWAMTIFGVTLLTSLYGFFVERRDF